MGINSLGNNSISGGPKKELHFCKLTIPNQEIPGPDNEFVTIRDEENFVVKILDVTLGECKEIIDALDPVVVTAMKLKNSQLLKFRGKTKNINFFVCFFPEDGEDLVSIVGRNIEDETNEGSYCHDFEIEGITIEDWNKLKTLIQN